MKRVLSIIILSLFLMGILSVAYAQEDQDIQDRPMRRLVERRFKGMYEELNLTEQQQEELSKLRLAHQKEMIKLRSELQVLQLDLQTMLEPKSPDKAKVYAQIDKINKLKNEMSKMRIDHMLKRRAVFTPEQWDKIKDRMGNRGFSRIGRKFLRGHFSRSMRRPFHERRW